MKNNNGAGIKETNRCEEETNVKENKNSHGKRRFKSLEGERKNKRKVNYIVTAK